MLGDTRHTRPEATMTSTSATLTAALRGNGVEEALIAVCTGLAVVSIPETSTDRPTCRGSSVLGTGLSRASCSRQRSIGWQSVRKPSSS